MSSSWTSWSGFSHFFPKEKKVRDWVRTRGRNCSPSRAHHRRRLSWRISSWTQLVCGCVFQVVGGNFWARTQKSGSRVSLRLLVEEFRRVFLFFVLAQFALGIWYTISFVLASGSYVPGVWVLLRSTEIEFFGRCLIPLVQCFVQQWIHVLRGLWKNLQIYYVAADSNPDSVSSPFGLIGEVCPVEASSVGNLEVLFTSFTWLRCVIRDRFFFFGEAPVSVTGAGGAGVAGVFYSQVTRHQDCQLDRSVVST